MATVTSYATCAHCASTFGQRRKDQRFCGKPCKRAAKDQRRKPKRLAGDRAREGRDPTKFRNLSDPRSVTAKYGLDPRAGYTAAAKRAPTVYYEVAGVLDCDDDFADLDFTVSHPLPTGTWVEMPF